MRILLARSASILGHPLLLMPAAALGVAVSRDASEQLTRSLVLILAGVVTAALAFSTWSVLSGRWAHIDASDPSERRSLNWFLAAMLFTVGAIAWSRYPSRELAFGFLVSALAVLVALALLPVFKISLHTCFAAIAAGLLWPNPFFITAGLLVVGAVAWSRLVLRRHTIAEVLWGGLVGAASAIGYHALVG